MDKTKKQPLEFTGRPGAVCQEIRRRILAGDLPSGTRLPPTQEMASEYQVSKNTISLAMQRLVEEGLIERRRGDGTYVAYQGAPIAHTESRTIGVCLPMLTMAGEHLNPVASPTWFQIFGGIASRLEEKGYSTVIIPRNGVSLTEQVRQHHLSGLLLPNREEYIEEVLSSGLNRILPSLFIGRPGDFASLNYAEELDESELVRAFAHLKQRGYRRIAVISSADTDYLHTLVWRSYRKALEGDSAYSIHYERPISEGASQEEYDIAIGQLLSLPNPPDILLVIRKRFLQGTLTALEHLKMKRPGALPLVLLENGDVMDAACAPYPQMRILDKTELGRIIADDILELVEKRSDRIHHSIPWNESTDINIKQKNRP